MILPGELKDEFARVHSVEFDGKVETLRAGTCGERERKQSEHTRVTIRTLIIRATHKNGSFCAICSKCVSRL